MQANILLLKPDTLKWVLNVCMQFMIKNCFYYDLNNISLNSVHHSNVLRSIYTQKENILACYSIKGIVFTEQKEVIRPLWCRWVAKPHIYQPQHRSHTVRENSLNTFLYLCHIWIFKYREKFSEVCTNKRKRYETNPGFSIHNDYIKIQI